MSEEDGGAVVGESVLLEVTYEGASWFTFEDLPGAPRTRVARIGDRVVAVRTVNPRGVDLNGVDAIGAVRRVQELEERARVLTGGDPAELTEAARAVHAARLAEVQRSPTSARLGSGFLVSWEWLTTEARGVYERVAREVIRALVEADWRGPGEVRDLKKQLAEVQADRRAADTYLEEARTDLKRVKEEAFYYVRQLRELRDGDGSIEDVDPSREKLADLAKENAAVSTELSRVVLALESGGYSVPHRGEDRVSHAVRCVMTDLEAVRSDVSVLREELYVLSGTRGTDRQLLNRLTELLVKDRNDLVQVRHQLHDRTGELHGLRRRLDDLSGVACEEDDEKRDHLLRTRLLRSSPAPDRHAEELEEVVADLQETLRDALETAAASCYALGFDDANEAEDPGNVTRCTPREGWARDLVEGRFFDPNGDDPAREWRERRGEEVRDPRVTRTTVEREDDRDERVVTAAATAYREVRDAFLTPWRPNQKLENLIAEALPKMLLAALRAWHGEERDEEDEK